MFYGEAVVTTATAERRCCLIMLIHDYPAIEHRKNVFLDIYYDHKLDIIQCTSVMNYFLGLK